MCVEKRTLIRVKRRILRENGGKSDRLKINKRFSVQFLVKETPLKLLKGSFSIGTDGDKKLSQTIDDFEVVGWV